MAGNNRETCLAGGGKDAGGDTAIAPGYGYESCHARHDKTCFPEDSEFYMTFLCPLQFINPDGSPIAVIGWEQAQGRPRAPGKHDHVTLRS